MRKIYVLDREEELKQSLSKVFKKEDQVRIKRFNPYDFDKILKSTPDILVINEDGLKEDESIIEICKKIRDDEDNAITPIIVISSNEDNDHIVEILKNEVEKK